MLPLGVIGILSTFSGANEVPDHKLSEWSFGNPVAGESYAMSDLEGKVVVIEDWGTRCGPCLAAIPHMAQLDKRYKKRGLRIIARERQGSEKEAILEILKKNRAEYTVTSGGSGPNMGNGIPRAMVFDTSGQLVFTGHPADNNFDKAIKKALREVGETPDNESAVMTEPVISSRTWTNDEGKKIVASVREVSEDVVKFQMNNGRLMSYEIAKLSLEDQEVLVKAREAIDQP